MKIKKKLKKSLSLYRRYRITHIVYPRVYKKEAKKPLKDDKVIFLELRLSELSNSYKELYDYLVQNYNLDIHCHFLRKGFVSKKEHAQRTLDFIKDAATAKYIIYDEGSDIAGCLPKRKGTKILNTWHGCGAFKKFGYSTASKIFGDTEKNMNRFPAHPDYDIVTVSSPEVAWAYVEAMRKENKPECIQPLGISRTDTFYKQEFIDQSYTKLYSLMPNARGKKVILYAPTFRGRVAAAESPDMLNIKMFFDNLSNDYVLVFKHHPIVKQPPSVPLEYHDFAVDFTKEMQIEELLCVADICISDYSSLVFEYSLFEKPLIFFAYDLDNFFDWRGFYYNYEELAPGPVCITNSEMIDYIRNVEVRFDKERVHQFREKFMVSCDGHATERIVNQFFGIEIESFRRDSPLVGTYHEIPDSKELYSDYLEKIEFVKRLKALAVPSYVANTSAPVKKENVVLICDDEIDRNIFYSLEIQLRENDYKFQTIHLITMENVEEIVKKIAEASIIISAGEPVLLRLLPLRNETKIIQVSPDVIPLFKRWKNSKKAISNYYAEEFLIAPYAVKYDVIMETALDASSYYELNYPLKENGQHFMSGNLLADMLFDETYINKAKEKICNQYPVIKNRKIILFFFKYRLEYQNKFIQLLLKLYEPFVREYYCLVLHENEISGKIISIPEYLNGFAANPDIFKDNVFNAVELMACADVIIGDYIPQAMLAASKKKMILWAPDRYGILDDDELNMNYDELFAYLGCFGADDIIQRIQTPEISEMQKAFNRKYLVGCDGKTAERLVSKIQEI